VGGWGERYDLYWRHEQAACDLWYSAIRMPM